MRTTARVALTFSAFLVVLGAVSPAAADTGTVVVTFSGEAYGGPPEFLLSFDEVPIASGEVDSAIDTATAGRLREVNRIEPYLQTFEFLIPDGVFDPHGKIQIEFPNDAYGGEGLDRNLVIYNIVVNGRAVSSRDIVVTAGGIVQSPELIMDRVVLSTDGLVATVSAPDAGWPQTEAEAKGEATANEAPAVASAPEGATPGGLAPVEGEATVPDHAELVSNCEAETLTVTGFGRGLVNVPVAQTEDLEALAAGIAGKACRVSVEGYSSHGGNADINENLAKGRAIAVLQYLKDRGVAFSSEEVISHGETSEFGPTDAENQRVVVTVGP